MKYNDNFKYPVADAIEINDPDGNSLVFDVMIYPDHAPLKFRREEMQLSQQQVADLSRITLRQYQRFESGERSLSSASMRIGLSICRVLNLDPYRFVEPPTSK